MSSTLILPDFTEIKALQEKFEVLKDLSVVPAGDRLQKQTGKIYLDLTFDLFHKQVTPAYIFQFFSEMEAILSNLDLNNCRLIVLRNYPFKTNLHPFLQKQKQLDQYLEYLTAFYHIKSVYVPTIISRHSFSCIQNPPVSIINSLRMDCANFIKIKKTSRFILIYDMDFLDLFLEHDEALEKDLILEGVEVTLDEISSRAKNITGDAPISFDTASFINYEYPSAAADIRNTIHYDLEDMIMDITSNLF